MLVIRNLRSFFYKRRHCFHMHELKELSHCDMCSSLRRAQLTTSAAVVKDVYAFHSNYLHSTHDFHQQESNYSYKNHYKILTWASNLAIIIAFCDKVNGSKSGDSLFQAAKSGSISDLERLIAEGVDVNMQHPLGWTALQVAAVNNNIDAAKILLQAGADPNVFDEFINAPKTAKEKDLTVQDVVLTREADFHSHLNTYATFTRFTALHYAVLCGNYNMVSLLLESGANPTLENEVGHRPIDYCRDDKIGKLLHQHLEKYEERVRLKEVEEKRKFPLEQRLKEALVGQVGAIATVASAVQRKESGWTDDEHPLVFLFLGSSGIGKTELAKHLAIYIHKNVPNTFIRLDMSEYQEKHEVSKLIGAPPGYIGHEDGGQLTSRLRMCPKAVVLFDEVDKAHTDVLTVLLQLFDEGRLTDGKGQTITCKDAIFVMTSNLASDEIAKHAIELRKGAKQYFDQREEGKIDVPENKEDIKISRNFKLDVVQPILKEHFRRDEFLGRINEIIYFLPFSTAELTKLVSKELIFWAKKAMKMHEIKLTWDPEVETVLANGYNIHYGARSIKYEVERRVVSQLASAHVNGLVNKGGSVHLKAVWPSKPDEEASVTIVVNNCGDNSNNPDDVVNNSGDNSNNPDDVEKRDFARQINFFNWL